MGDRVSKSCLFNAKQMSGPLYWCVVHNLCESNKKKLGRKGGGEGEAREMVGEEERDEGIGEVNILLRECLLGT